jgi:membrane fusion protein (multidrug efflux system)
MMKPRPTVRRSSTSLRTHVAEETRRHPVEEPGAPDAERPGAPPAGTADAAAKPGKRKFIMIAALGLLALAAIGYGAYFVLVGRFYVSTDDAYVRANNTTLGARVSGHVAAILPRDNSIVRAGDVIFRIDDGDYRIAVDAARAGSRPSRPPIDRIGRQVTALESAVEQTKAQLASAEAGAEARRSRLRSPADAEHQGFCLARRFRSFRGQPRSGHCRGEVGAGR